MQHSRRPVRLAVFLAVSCFCHEPRAHADEPEILRVTVHLHVAKAIASRVIRRDIEDEAESLWKPYGVRLVWGDTPDPGEETAFALEAIVERPPISNWVAVLGHTSFGLDPPRKPIRVSFDQTERVLASRAASWPWNVHDRKMARALGRVLAHEIGHVLLAVPSHDRVGLMRASFDPAELADPNPAPFRLTCNAVGRLRSRAQVLTRAAAGF
jgi:hypothetical protein